MTDDDDLKTLLHEDTIITLEEKQLQWLMVFLVWLIAICVVILA